jgi:hypothetical protein
VHTAEAKRNGMATGPKNKRQVARTIRTARTALNVSRDLVRSLHALQESFDFDFFGRVVWQADEKVDEVANAVSDLLRLARDDYPDQEIEINVTVKVPEAVPASGTEDAERGQTA